MMEKAVTIQEKNVRFIVDRIEGEFAVCECLEEVSARETDTSMLDVRLSNIPFEVSEGDELIGYYLENKEVVITSKKIKDTSKKVRIPTKLVRFL